MTGRKKEKYNRIGKEEKDGIVIEEPDEETKWLETQRSMLYNFEEKNINFGKAKPTNWKNNKRVHLPKAGSAQLEGFIEVRRREAIKTFDTAMRALGYNEKKDKEIFDNLTQKEQRGLKSLQKRIKNKELIVCSTDKSGRFCVLSREDYIKAGEEHTKNDTEVDNDEAEEIQRILNGHMRWWSGMLNQSSDWNQEDRACRNLLTNGLNICPMTLMIKDHKTWSLEDGESPPSRSIMNGKIGMNNNMSEFVSLILEPIANEDKKNMETNATDGLISDIERVNKEWESSQVEDKKVKECEGGGIEADHPLGGV
jgi:hypothetical protein